MNLRYVIPTIALIAAAGGPFDIASAIGQADPKPAMTGNGYTSPLSSLDLEKFHDVNDRDRARAKEESRQIIADLQMSCAIAQAERVARGTTQVDGKSVPVNLYEVACDNATGYLLEARGSLTPLAISCFAAEATRAEDVARGAKADLYCQLPPNRDVKAMAASLVKASGTDCVVTESRWFGISASKQTEYSEVACADGTGYLLKIAISGGAPVSTMSCQDAARQGLRCHLTDGGPVPMPITKQTFREQLKKYNIGCEPADLRIVGREAEDKRYVIEVQCPELPRGLIAFVPLDDNAHKFEAIDCAAASERQILCELKAK
jgi:hypothetical protein